MNDCLTWSAERRATDTWQRIRRLNENRRRGEGRSETDMIVRGKRWRWCLVRWFGPDDNCRLGERKAMFEFTGEPPLFHCGSLFQEATRGP